MCRVSEADDQAPPEPFGALRVRMEMVPVSTSMRTGPEQVTHEPSNSSAFLKSKSSRDLVKSSGDDDDPSNTCGIVTLTTFSQSDALKCKCGKWGDSLRAVVCLIRAYIVPSLKITHRPGAQKL